MDLMNTADFLEFHEVIVYYYMWIVVLKKMPVKYTLQEHFIESNSQRLKASLN